jgi:hypothetical protein
MIHGQTVPENAMRFESGFGSVWTVGAWSGLKDRVAGTGFGE